ncbi:MAG: DUF2784 domain-containing protein [Gammaproteobacteria bacterium]|nr:DUF2784 domain-containing protein [Gammaproteobacteria bacterium]
MVSNTAYLFAADAVLLIHFLFVCFVVLGLVLILAGKPLAWDWVHHRPFRIVHLFAIGIVVVQSWLGAICPLTLWEMNWREKAGDAVYTGSFIAHWLERLLFYQAPPWVFILIYTLFGSLVALSWYWVRPRK